VRERLLTLGVRFALLHGFAQVPAAWEEVRAALPARLRAAAATCPLPGHDPGLPVAGWDDAVDALAARLAADQVTLAVGYSFGARLALGLLARDAVAGAVLVGVNPGLADPVERTTRRAADAAWAVRLRAIGTAAFLEEWEAQPLFATQAKVDPERRQRRRASRLALAPGPLADALDRLGTGAMPDLTSALVARARRAHLIVGSDDVRFRAIARGLAGRAPALAVDVVDGSGHDPTLEAPAALAAVVARALVRLAPG
jgi:2-succinyl-6-hydroxy-2,4-cyclohexadiene-1-carboxylate synthase